MTAIAHPTASSAADLAHASAGRPLDLCEARQLRDSLKSLLRTEQSALADFLVALAGFDRRRGYEALGHASLFAFLNVELGLTPAPTYWRIEAARLLQRFPDLVDPVRQGRLCLTTIGELAKVLTVENRSAVLPRFLGISSREAKEIVAELQPRAAPPMRTVITPLAPVRHAGQPAAIVSLPLAAASVAKVGASARGPAADTDPGSLWAPNVEPAAPVPVAPRRDEIDPLTAELSRLSTTVSRRFLQKLKTARAGLGHAVPGATTEQVLEAALDLLLEKQASSRGQVKRPPKTVATATPPTSNRRPTAPPAPRSTEAPPHRRDGPRAAIPAAVQRAVWVRDQGRCTWPLDGGGTCGSTHRLQLDHIVPWAEWGGETEGNLRVVCAAHNTLAARVAFGERWMGRYRGRSASRPG